MSTTGEEPCATGAAHIGIRARLLNHATPGARSAKLNDPPEASGQNSAALSGASSVREDSLAEDLNRIDDAPEQRERSLLKQVTFEFVFGVAVIVLGTAALVILGTLFRFLLGL